MHYYHDPDTRTVFEVPEPFVEPKYTKHKRPRYEGCSVSVVIEVISGKNYRKADGTWAQPRKRIYHRDYDSRDRPEEAKRMLLILEIGSLGQEISKEEFHRLAAQYRAEADGNRQPK